MHVTAVRHAGTVSSDKGEVVSLFVRNISKSGLCCIASHAMGCDEELMLFIPPQGGRGGRDVRCRVTRCEELEGRFRIGLVFRDPLNEAGSQLH